RDCLEYLTLSFFHTPVPVQDLDAGSSLSGISLCTTAASLIPNAFPIYNHSAMARSPIHFLAPICAVALICSLAAAAASVFQPISDSHRSAALEIFHRSFSSLEETYEALRTFQVLGVENKPDVGTAACLSVSQTLGSSSSSLKDTFYALNVNGVLKCEVDAGTVEGIVSRLQSAVSSAASLLEFYYSIGGLVLVKDQALKDDLYLADAEGIFRSIKALSQSDGRWRFNSNNPESSTYAAGLAHEALAGAVSLSSSEIDQSLVSSTKNDILKLFERIEKYEDGSLYFDEEVIDDHENQGPITITWSVVRGITSFAAATSESLNLPGEKILGLAKFFLRVGIPGDAKDLFSQVDSLACLEKNRQVLSLIIVCLVSIPLILSLPATVISSTTKDTIKVKVSTPLGSDAPPLTVKLLRATSAGLKDTSAIESQELKFDPEYKVYALDTSKWSVDLGKYICVFEIIFHDPEHTKAYAAGSKIEVPVFVTGAVKVENAEIAVLNSDRGSMESQKNLDFTGENLVSLSANHLQKLRLRFQLSTPIGNPFKPHQAILKLTHESKVEHVFVVGNAGKQFQIVLDFLGLVEKFYYLSGKYEIQLTVGDAVMENPCFKVIGHLDLDLPEAPEKAPRAPAQLVDMYSRYGPKAEIAHIFRAAEKRPPQELSLAFLGLTILPLLGFLIGLLRLGVNLKNFPSSAGPAAFAALFHLGIGAVLLLYVFFWLKLNLFTTLRMVGLLGTFLLFVGHRTLSYLASPASKLKSA
ncbi:Dolichyl-diphosphooligosaccharide--protein glycosyltransferase subunit 2, partial [Linum grandiflorum]